MNITINKPMNVVISALMNHPQLMNKKREWNIFTSLTFEMDPSLVTNINKLVEDDEFPVLGDQNKLEQKWMDNWCNGVAKNGFLRPCKCNLMVSPFDKSHNICIPKEEESNSPHSILLKEISEGKYSGKPNLDPKNKYSTLTQLNLAGYYPMFVSLHSELVYGYCIHLLKKSNTNGIELAVFCNYLIDMIKSKHNSPIFSFEWDNTYIVIERFAAIKNNSTKEIVLKLWMSKASILSSQRFCETLDKETKRLIEVRQIT